MHPLIGNLAIRPEGGIDWTLVEAAATRLSIDDLLDFAEVDEVGRSWRDATHANLERTHARDARTKRQADAKRRALGRIR